MDRQRRAPILFLEETDSTNLALRRLAEENAADGTVLWAARQTAGRGRLGRSFSSPEGGLYLSLLLRQSEDPARDLSLTPAAAVAAARALEGVCSLRCGVKWPNDLVCGGKKLCGILCESFAAHGKRFVVLGIGINVNTAAFPPVLREIAASVRQLTGKKTPLPTLAEALTEELDAAVAAARRGDGALLADYRARCVSVGREVLLLRGGESRPAFALGVNGDFSLRVRLPDGSEEDVRSGEVSLRTKE
ncbi:MAG: biotin--[acetyl-CoA-carboxylase] ligase [Clostridia bacterium]